MYIFLTAFFFVIAYTGIYIYTISSRSLEYFDLKLLLLPLILFPILYLANLGFSAGWLASKNTPYTPAAIGIMALAMGVLVFLVGDIAYYKITPTIQTFVGAAVIILGAIILVYK